MCTRHMADAAALERVAKTRLWQPAGRASHGGISCFQSVTTCSQCCTSHRHSTTTKQQRRRPHLPVTGQLCQQVHPPRRHGSGQARDEHERRLGLPRLLCCERCLRPACAASTPRAPTPPPLQPEQASQLIAPAAAAALAERRAATAAVGALEAVVCLHVQYHRVSTTESVPQSNILPQSAYNALASTHTYAPTTGTDKPRAPTPTPPFFFSSTSHPRPPPPWLLACSTGPVRSLRSGPRNEVSR